MEKTFKEALETNDIHQIKKHIDMGVNLNKLINYRFPIFF